MSKKQEKLDIGAVAQVIESDVEKSLARDGEYVLAMNSSEEANNLGAYFQNKGHNFKTYEFESKELSCHFLVMTR